MKDSADRGFFVVYRKEKNRMIQLSKRLQTVAGFVKKDAIVADIGSDHAYLPTYLVKKGIIRRAIAGEVVKGPYESAVRNVKRENVTENITVRLANGLAAIETSDQIDTVTIAGMGGALIATILEEGKEKLANVERIIAQPNIHAEAIRKWAVANEWYIVDESILKEDDKIYEIVVLEKGRKTYTEMDYLLGPFLLKEKNTVFEEKWKREMTQWKNILQSLKDATEDASIEEKKATLHKRIKLVEEVLRN